MKNVEVLYAVKWQFKKLFEFTNVKYGEPVKCCDMYHLMLPSIQMQSPGGAVL